ncbi:Hsp20/alpha crystallin family protein [bacterium]|nr:Hsp20/alpha crystallin family protein [bacterium]
MTIMRWNPFRELLNVQEEMNRVFNSYFSRSGEGQSGAPLLWTPSVDICETDDDITVTIEIPGMNKEDVKISLQDNVLTIEGEKRQEKKESVKSYHRIERSYGTFQRSFVLPASVKADKVAAQYKDGILNIKLPKTEAARPKEIEIAVH